MSYSPKIERLILELKGGVFFLSPREKAFLRFIEEIGVPEEIACQAIEECLSSVNPRKRNKYPTFLCFKKVMEEYENFLRLEAQRVEIDWEARFRKKLNAVRHLIRGKVPTPTNEEEAQRILIKLEEDILRNLWKKMSKEERKSIKDTFKEFQGEEEIFGELIKNEIKRLYGIPHLSLYRD